VVLVEDDVAAAAGDVQVQTQPSAHTPQQEKLHLDVPGLMVQIRTRIHGAKQQQLQQQQQVGKEGRSGGTRRLQAASLQQQQQEHSQEVVEADGVDDAATRELMHVFDKADFKRMEVCGQFNLGFMVARLGGDLFIIDQHASGE
jgi:DNA mismatch repair ATPase MutL